MGAERIWITWENHRRSSVLAEEFGCRLYVSDRKGPFRYVRSIVDTLRVLRQGQYDIVFVQNPSLILAVLVCLYAKLRTVKVVVDRHTTFFLERERLTPAMKVHNLLSDFTIRAADVTIVTNRHLARLVAEKRGRPLILPDKIPQLRRSSSMALSPKVNVVCISSFAPDEPVENVLSAAARAECKDITLYVTGDSSRLHPQIKSAAPPNVRFTGYLAMETYNDLLLSADVVMVLTTATHCMLCGCYEAVAARKPLITSRKEVLVDYFRGSIFVGDTAEEIADGMVEAATRLDHYQENARELSTSLATTWRVQREEVENRLAAM